MRTLVVVVAVLAMAGASASAVTNVLYSESFDSASAATGWNVNATSSDTQALFGWDYSSLGIPRSPNTPDTTTKALRLAANIADSPGTDTPEAITLSPIGQSFSGNYQVSFDMWMHHNGNYTGHTNGSTEFATMGIGYNDTAVNFSGSSHIGDAQLTETGSGGWFSVSSDGGDARDLRAYTDAVERKAANGDVTFPAGTTVDAQKAETYYYSQLGRVNVGAEFPGIGFEGWTEWGSVGFNWQRVVITVDGNTVTWEMGIVGQDLLEICTLDASVTPFSLDGNISIGYADLFRSVSAASEYSFALIDNLEVVPEPSTIAVLACGGLALLRRRR